MQSRVQSLLQGNKLEEIVQKIVLSDEQQLKKRKEDEFTRGERPDNTKIGKYQDAEYAFFKLAINPIANGYVDLMVTRSFLNKMRLQPDQKRQFVFNSSDFKQDRLLAKYGYDILQINQEWFETRQVQIYKFRLTFEINRYLKNA